MSSSSGKQPPAKRKKLKFQTRLLASNVFCSIHRDSGENNEPCGLLLKTYKVKMKNRKNRMEIKSDGETRGGEREIEK